MRDLSLLIERCKEEAFTGGVTHNFFAKNVLSHVGNRDTYVLVFREVTQDLSHPFYFSDLPRFDL